MWGGPPAPASNEQRRRSRHADHWIGYPPRLRRGGRLGRGRAQTAGARRHAPSSSRGFRKEAFEGGRGRRRSDRQRILSRCRDRAARQKQVVIANPMQVRIIAHAKIKTDTIDASVLAQLYASGFLPEVWIPDEPTQALRRQVTRRNQIVRQRSRLKNIIQSILHSHLIPSCPHADLCGASGRTWLFHQVLPEDERLAVERHLREFDRLGGDLKVIERDLAPSALGDEGVKRLMTIPGVDMEVALAIVAAIGEGGRFGQAQKAVGDPGLHPSWPPSG